MLAASTLVEEDPVKGIMGEQKLLVHKLAFDRDTAESVVEKEKTKFFARLVFFKPAVEEVVCESVQLFYEPFIVAKAHYFLDYYRENIYTAKIDDVVREVVAFGHVVNPEVVKGKGLFQRSQRAIVFNVHERILYENATHLAINRLGREIDPSGLLVGPLEPVPENTLKTMRDRVREFRVSHEDIVSLIQKRTAIRPQDIGSIIDEVFEVTEYTIVCTPIYEARCRRLSTGEIKILPISGVTGKTLSL